MEKKFIHSFTILFYQKINYNFIFGRQFEFLRSQIEFFYKVR